MPALAWGQFTLRGQVRNGQDQTPLPFATVFLANTTRGVLSNGQGQFVLTNVPPGKFDLVVSYLGFQPLKLTVQTSEATFYRIGLRPEENQLAGVTVKARSRRSAEWATNVEFFTTYFIGQSRNASQCRLLNPDVLYFENTTEKFVARAGEPLVVENRALGYRLKFLLSEFQYLHPKHRVQYDGDAVFETLDGTPQEQKRWAENRRKAYHGSLMHFMRALHQRQLVEEGFVVQPVVERYNRRGEPRLIGLPGDTLVKVKSLKGNWDVAFPSLRIERLLDTLRSTPTQPIVSFQGLMQVTYTREPESTHYQRARPLAEHGYRIRPQTSVIQLIQPSIAIEPSGHFYDPQGILCKDYWSWEVIAEELPLDYEP